ncbi:MAG: DUF3530 family protein [Oceanospirillales bacterium]|nr:DUF3530 family protein [Oceanospirillales bacterium]
MLKRLLVLACLISAPASSAADLPRYSAGSDTPQAYILQQLGGSHELIDVNVEGDQFRLLYRPAMTPKPLGAVLLLPDPGSGNSWLEQVRALMAYLPEHGWTVIAVEPPELPSNQTPQRTAQTTGTATATNLTVDENTDPSSNATPPAMSFAQQMQQRLQEAHNTLVRRAPDLRQRIITGMGRSAVWSAAWAQGKDDGVNLLLIDPRPSPETEQSLEALLPLTGRRTLIDLYHAPLPGYPNAEPDARQRRLLAHRASLKHYHQSRLPGAFRGWQADMPWLTRHVRGLLERIILDDSRKLRGKKTETPSLPVQTSPGSKPISASREPT